jgi:hypothetical protein
MALFQLAFLFTGCEKEIMAYKGQEGVYFAVRWGDQFRDEKSWPYQPFSNVEFVRIGKDMVDYSLKVDISGPVKDYDRTFGLEVNPDSTTAVLGQHYEAVAREWKIPAGALSTIIKVRLHRTSDLETVPKTLGLRLVASPQLSLSFPEWNAIPSLDGGAAVAKFNASLHTLRINDIMVQPAVWSGSIQPGNKESGLFGVFTRKKMEFLEENLGLTYGDFASTATMPMVRQLLISSDATIILVKRFNEKKPVLEADGRLMWMGTVPWTTIIGVPYIP